MKDEDKCCKTCKHRLGENGNEIEMRNDNLKIRLNIFSNCAKHQQMFSEILADPYDSVIGNRFTFKPDFGCSFYEGDNDIAKDEVCMPVEVQHTPVDFTEPRPSIYADAEAEPVVVKPDVPEQPPMPTFDDVPDYETDDIPF